ncbi:ER alpha-1,6-mannosyltransferase-like protein [Malassezia sympodialis ATCC 42132]|uniref:ER alpha-1,6-mannosyltransferase-like protein n=1 Tax=Malassezia sympodialis (strain ATCC 42132) TaxID=1230383 RepID=UPI0002C1B05C|nr:ER alpha-1,6-mannosyltransferase-like protein [Malassezia sympodialis ATCC 42132]CCU99276.1 ER alpha-1,6-mannosyltransferase-like protein [Malassezia sympodialis ATCC 42132]|eukprot:XP_018740534.1 ER alpha-1,6-mannosyltransferase-like protein [Malassezia sympodialis ATCC 42132]
MRGAEPWVLAALLVAVLTTHVIVAPSTKVEESFTLQAVHDIWAFGIRPEARSQFHLPFWAGRTTPNSVALPLVLIALALVVRRRRMYVGLALLAATAVVLRLELLGLAIPCYLAAWIAFDRPLVHLVPLGLTSCVAGVALSILVDSYFWQGPFLWPEGDALLFNVVEGHSAEWGIAPWSMYMTQALPRLLAAGLPMAALGAIVYLRDRTTALLAWIAGVHVALLSALPHKEWRFILYTVPLWNALAARGMHRCLAYPGGILVAGGVLAISAAQCVLSLAASAHNYPGGAALALLHERVRGAAHVHIDTLSAMTGVSLFQSKHLARASASWVPSQAPAWIYNKTESPQLDLCLFTHMLSERACPPGFRDMAAPIQGLSRVQLQRPADFMRLLDVVEEQTQVLHGIRGGTARLRRECVLHKLALVRLDGQDPVLDRVVDEEAVHGDGARLPKAVDTVDRLSP